MQIDTEAIRRAAGTMSGADTVNRYETGGVPSLPPHLQDAHRKCADCGTVFVGSTLSPCPKCAEENRVVALNKIRAAE
jgi:hypothetical protein